jgi:hypothetical protein
MNTKKSAVNYLFDRMNTYKITHENRAQDNLIVKEILKNNGYQQQNTYRKYKYKPPFTNTTHETQTTEWSTFTYYGPDTTTITKLFRNTNLKIAYKTTNTIENHLKPKDKITDI